MPRFLVARALPVVAAATLLGASLAGAAAGATAAGTGAARGGSPRVIFGPVRYALSNWGGYIALGSAGKFTIASAHWTIASVKCASRSDLYAPWVGIDGDGDQTVEQTGVQTACNTGSPVHSAWYEMYPAPPVYFSNAISTGDVISASVSYAAGVFTIRISDTTKKWTHTVHKSLSASRLSAEAVIEAPGGGGTYPTITAVKFTGVKFNKLALATFKPVASDTGTTTHEYVPSAITNGDNFSMVPKA